MKKQQILQSEVALQIAKAALSNLFIELQMTNSDEGVSLQPSYAWMIVYIWHNEMERQSAEEIAASTCTMRESLEILNAVASCDGYGLHENLLFWTEVWNSRRTQMGSRSLPLPRNAELNLLVPSKEHDYPRFLLKPEWPSYYTESVHQVTETLFLSSKSMSDNLKYQNTMELLYAHMNPTHQHRAIHCGLYIDGSPNIEYMHTLLTNLAAATANRQFNEVPWHVPLILTEVFLPMGFYFISDHVSDLSPLLDALRIKVRRLKLDIWWFDNIASHHYELLELHMWDMGQKRYKSLTQLQENPLIIDSLEIIGRNFYSRFFSILCSAMLCLNDVGELKIDTRGQSSLLMWKWLALTFFHPESPSQVTGLTLPRFCVNQDHIQGIQEVLKLPWHTALQHVIVQPHDYHLWSRTMFTAFAYHRFPLNTVAWVLIKKNTRIYTHPKRVRFLSKSLVVLDHDETFPVIDILPEWLSNWICVLLPGYVYGFTKQRNVRRMDVVPVQRQSHGITTLTIDSDDMRATLGFLKLVGTPLTSLTISFNVAVTRKDFEELLSHCLNLSYLNIRAPRVDDISPLLDAYEKHQCTITSLQLDSQLFGWNTIHELMKHLASSMHSDLRELSFGSSFLDQYNLQDALYMLKHNRTLSFVHIPIREETRDYYLDKFLALRGNIVDCKLPLKIKLAFLSVIGYHSNNNSAMKRADQNVLRSIFEFASYATRVISIGS